MKQLLLGALMLFSGLVLVAQVPNDTTQTNKFDWSKFTLKGAGVVNYYAYDWDIDSTRRNEFDAERFNVYLGYQFSDRISLKTEIEIEHGGTGVTKEFDRFEEFGEFETEVEAGGEVKLEQMNIFFKIRPWLNIRAGRLKVYMGLASKLDEPVDYFTTHFSEMENELLPLGWYENGIEFSGVFGKSSQWQYKAYVINGLDGTGFSSKNWIKRGHQRRFETVFSDALAFSGKLEYLFGQKNFIGLSSYLGNSTPNRPKKDLVADAFVHITDLHFRLHKNAFKLRGMVLYGTLSNSEKVSEANRNISNKLNVKRTPVGSAALGWYLEGAFNVLSLTENNTVIDLFARYDNYDSMYKVEGNIFDYSRWERKVITGGLNYFPHNQISIKAQYSVRTLGITENNKERTFSLGLGFKF